MKDLGRLKKSLLSLWSWCIAIERGVLWNDVVRGKSGEHEGDWSTDEVRGGYRLEFGRQFGGGGPLSMGIFLSWLEMVLG